MRIAILGAGAIATSLAHPWSAKHDVVFGLRDPGRVVEIPHTKVTGLREAVEGSDVTVMAIPSDVIPEVARTLAAELADRVVIDPTIRFTPGGSPLMNRYEDLAAAGVRYIRAFSTQGPEVLDAPVVDGQVADQFFTADDDESRRLASELIADIGLRPVYVGGSDRVNIVDGITRLWFSLAIKQDLGRHLSFRLLND